MLQLAGMNLTVQHSFQSSDRSDRGDTCIIAQDSYRDYIRQEVQPTTLVRESSRQLIRYSLDTYMYIGYSTYLLIFKSQKGSIEARIFSYLPHKNCLTITP